MHSVGCKMLQSSNTVAQVSGYQTIVSSAVTCFLASVRQQRDGTSLNHNNMCVHFSGGCIWGASACSSRGTRARCWHCGSDAVPCSPPQPGNIPLFACTCVHMFFWASINALMGSTRALPTYAGLLFMLYTMWIYRQYFNSHYPENKHFWTF